MAYNQGFKVAKSGKSVLTDGDKDMVFSSKFQTMRVKQQGSGSLTHSSRTATIAHNLGYVPMFLVESDVSAVPGLFPSGAYAPLPFAQSYGYYQTQWDADVVTWADTTNIYIKAQNDFGYKIFEANDVCEEDATGYWRDWFGFGYQMPTYDTMHGALRFGPVTVAKNASITDAQVGMYVATRVGSSTLYSYMWGIDEDNTGDFGSNPLGRTKTDARGRPEANPSAGTTMWFGCASQVQEIVNRSGWSSGNNLGLLFRQEGPDGQSPSGNGFYSLFTSNRFWLKVLTTSTLLNYNYTIFRDPLI